MFRAQEIITGDATMTIEEFDYKVGDMLLWTRSDAVCLVTEKDDETVTIHIMDGGVYPKWRGENRSYGRHWLEKDDFVVLHRAEPDT